MINTLIFDCDGLIVDTEGPEYQTWRELFQAYNTDLQLADWVQCVGGDGGFDPYVQLEQQIGRPIDRDAVRVQRRGRMKELLEGMPVLPGVVDYLDAAERRGMKLAVASSSGRDWVEGHLARLGLIHRFDAICTRDDVPRVKPDPALYLLAAEAVGVPAQQALVLEDSRNGLLAAKAAGARCVVVPNGVTGGLNFDEADYRLTSLAEMSLDDLLEIVA